MNNHRGISLHSLPGRVYAKMSRKLLNQSWMIPSAVFVVAVALQTKVSLQQIFEKSWEHAKGVC